jgi:hypothetical protein
MPQKNSKPTQNRRDHKLRDIEPKKSPAGGKKSGRHHHNIPKGAVDVAPRLAGNQSAIPPFLFRARPDTPLPGGSYPGNPVMAGRANFFFN